MNARASLLTAVVVLLGLTVCQTWAITLSFEETTTDGFFSYWTARNIWFQSNLTPTDHSTSDWGPPRSGHNVLTGNWPSTGAMVKFGYLDIGFKPMRIYRFGRYFSTEPGVVLELEAAGSGVRLSSAYIGDAGTSWNNHHLEVICPEGLISSVTLCPVSSPDALLHWCVDDLTIEFVPEPSSLASLSLALLAAGVGVRWRRRG